MKIEVLNGSDGKTVVRGIDPSDGDEQFGGCTLDPGQKQTITLPDVHEARGVEFGQVEAIDQASIEEGAAEAAA